MALKIFKNLCLIKGVTELPEISIRFFVLNLPKFNCQYRLARRRYFRGGRRKI